MKLLQVALLLLLLSFAANAALLEFHGYPAGINDGSSYVGLAAGKLDNVNISMWCVDPDHAINASQWQVTVYSLSNPAALNGLLSGATGQEFQAMFLLARGFNNTNADIVIQHEIWSLVDPGSFSLTPSQQLAVNNALASVGQFDFSHAYLYVPTSQYSSVGQIFESGSVVPTPEPATVVLLGLGIGTLLLARRQLRPKDGKD